MSTDWRPLLDQLLDGDALSEAEARALAEALDAPPSRRQAAEWMAFEARLRERFAPGGAAAVALSRERLLADAALRQKEQEMWRRLRRRRRVRRALVAAAAVVVGVGGWLALKARPAKPQAVETYQEPEASGDFRSVGSERPESQGGPIRRGDELLVGPGGARLALGGYCELVLRPESDVVLRGEARKEEIELKKGTVVSHIVPNRGEFRVRTPLGVLDAVGTEFVTTVENPQPQKGDGDVGKLRKSAVVTVLVVSGTVAYYFGDLAGVLGAGMGQAFGAEEAVAPPLPDGLQGFKGMLVGTLVRKWSAEGEFVLKIERIAVIWKEYKGDDDAPERAVGKEVTVALTRQNRLYEQHARTLRSLKVGDPVLVEAFHLGGNRLTVIETLRRAGAASLEGERREGEGARREGEGVRREGGGEAVRREGEGEGVRREGEGERREGEGVRREGEAPGLLEGFGGFQGILVGTIVSKAEDEFVLKVEKVSQSWRNSKARSPESLVGKDVEITLRREGRVNDRLARALAERKVGERVEVGAQHIEGNVLAAIEVLRKARPASEEGRGEGEGREGGERKIRRGEGEGREGGVRREGEGREGERREGTAQASGEAVQGFRGLLQGTVASKSEDGFILRVEKVAKVWQSSQAKNPEGFVGKSVSIAVRRGEGGDAAVLKAFADLKVGDRVVAGAIHQEGNRLLATETLRKAGEGGEF